MRAFTICFTGMSGSGKTTLAAALREEMGSMKNLQFIDGDVLRKQMGNLFGYTKEERMKNSRVSRLLAKYLNDNGINVILAVVAPYEEMRSQFREFLGESYIQVYVECSYEECSRRDVKGYYKKQKEGKMQNLNGADDVFEIPQNNELVVNTEQETVSGIVKRIIGYLQEKGYEI